MFATVLGVFISMFLIIIIFASIIGGIISSTQDSKKVEISENSILHLKLDKEIKDRPGNNPFENFDFSSFEDRTPLGLKSIIDNIKKAKSDDKIKGIYLNVANLKANMATTEELRNALLDFKSSGKFILSYSENYSQNEYYLSSIADEIYLNPSGEMTFKGLSATLMFFKDALNRLDIDMQVIRHGKFKSAIEPFIRNDMSVENRAQYTQLISGIWKHRNEMLSQSRNIPISELNKVADGLLLRTAKEAKDYGFVDDLRYEDEITSRLKELLEISEDDKLNLVSFNDFKKTVLPIEIAKLGRERWNAKDEIAIIYAEGDITSGESKENSMGSKTIAKALQDARKDKNVKAIVLRVNSPGGSALASDVMWREVMLAKKEKPVVVSMGDVAASGGYYISCAADKIYAENATITGSIGVFGLIPNFGKMMSSKLGIHTDQVVTNKYSDGLTLSRPLKEKEKEMLQDMIENIYDDFTLKVAEGRGMSQADVDSIGQGRVWNGQSAKKIGLVDEIGGIEEAIVAAADLADLESYKTKELPKQKIAFEALFSQFATEAKIKIFGSEFGQAEVYYHNVKRVMESNGIYSRMPVDVMIE